jgi:hypothetical protein
VILGEGFTNRNPAASCLGFLVFSFCAFACEQARDSVQNKKTHQLCWWVSVGSGRGISSLLPRSLIRGGRIQQNFGRAIARPCFFICPAAFERARRVMTNKKPPAFQLAVLLVAGDGFEPTTFGL